MLLRSFVILFITLSAFAAFSADEPLAQSRRSVPKPANLISREAWGSKPDRIPDSRRQTPKWITLHHAGVLWTNSKDPAQFVRDMQEWGKKRPQLEKPPMDTYWPDLPYHFLIAPDGRIFEGRPLEFEPESNTKYELSGHIGIEMMGDFNRQRPSPEQLQSAVQLTAWLLDAQKLPLEAIRTHRDVAQGQTECPGRDFYRYIEDGQFKHWVKGVLDGENPTIEPGPPLADPPGPTELVTKTTK
jgi:hypothetical protein